MWTTRHCLDTPAPALFANPLNINIKITCLTLISVHANLTLIHYPNSKLNPKLHLHSYSVGTCKLSPERQCPHETKNTHQYSLYYTYMCIYKKTLPQCCWGWGIPREYSLISSITGGCIYRERGRDRERERDTRSSHQGLGVSASSPHWESWVHFSVQACPFPLSLISTATGGNISPVLFLHSPLSPEQQRKKLHISLSLSTCPALPHSLQTCVSSLLLGRRSSSSPPSSLLPNADIYRCAVTESGAAAHISFTTPSLPAPLLQKTSHLHRPGNDELLHLSE